MTKAPLLDDPQHWLIRAKEARALARLADDPVCQQMMLRIAEDYDRLAKRAALRIKTDFKGISDSQ